MDDDAERTLIERAQAGDPLARHALFKLYRPRIYRVVNHILRDEADADDVVQEIFLRLLSALAAFRHESSFFTWIYKIAVNAARANLASRTRAAHLIPDLGHQTLEESYSSDADQPEVAHVLAETGRRLELAMTGLQPNQREAFLLRELDGLSYAEIADLMQCPVGTVRSRISRAKAFLAARLERPDLPLH